jgi:hypothetical protein
MMTVQAGTRYSRDLTDLTSRSISTGTERRRPGHRYVHGGRGGAARSGESVPIPGFGAVYKLYSRDNGGELAIVEHPFAVGLITAPHRARSRGMPARLPARSSRSSRPAASKLLPRTWPAARRQRAGRADAHGGASLHESGAFAKYGLTYPNPDWLDDVVARYGLNPRRTNPRRSPASTSRHP